MKYLQIKRERFKRIAEKRTQRILEDLRLLGNCANKGSYEYNEEEVNKIFSAIKKELKNIEILFKKTREKGFKL